MSVVEPSDGARNIVERVKNILLKPKETWDVVDAEPATIGGLYRGYVIPLAAIPAVCSLILSLIVAMGVGAALGGAMGGAFGAISAIVTAIVSYLFTLAAVYVLAFIIDLLAPSFGGVKDRLRAFKVAAYSGTAVWVASVAVLIPLLGMLVIIAGAVYSLYLLYLGLPKLMKVPEEKALVYVAALIGIGIAISFAVFLVLMPMRGLMHLGAASPAATGTLKIPGGASVDLGKLEAASKQLEAASKGGGDGVTPTDPEMLKSLLPASVQGFGRTGVSSASGGAGGVSGSTAEGVYTKGESRLTLTITDLGAAGALAGMAGAFNVNSSSESNGRYEKVGKVDGRMTTETYDRNSRHGEYGVLVGDRFMVQAQGDGVAIEDLKQAVAAVGPARLEALAKAS